MYQPGQKNPSVIYVLLNMSTARALQSSLFWWCTNNVQGFPYMCGQVEGYLANSCSVTTTVSQGSHQASTRHCLSAAFTPTVVMSCQCKFIFIPYNNVVIFLNFASRLLSFAYLLLKVLVLSFSTISTDWLQAVTVLNRKQQTIQTWVLWTLSKF